MGTGVAPSLESPGKPLTVFPAGSSGSEDPPPGDFEAGLRAASAIGDDRLQKMSQGYVSPDSFTHGSSSERTGWLRRGLETGDPGQCNTFR